MHNQSTSPFYTLPRVGYDNMFSIRFEYPYPTLVTSFVKYLESYFYHAFISSFKFSFVSSSESRLVLIFVNKGFDLLLFPVLDSMPR